jgi:hypothetical protein
MSKKHLVLDLDSTLISTYDDFNFLDKAFNTGISQYILKNSIKHINIIDVSSKHTGAGSEYKAWFALRPNLMNFLAFANEYFETVNVWSAGDKKYVYKIVGIIFPNKNPNIILTRNDCEFNKNTGEICKDLTKIYTHKDNKNANETNTLVLDDRADTFSRNKGNGIQIPVFEPFYVDNKNNIESTTDVTDIYNMLNQDTCLIQFEKWLMKKEVIGHNDVRLLNKNIFK